MSAVVTMTEPAATALQVSCAFPTTLAAPGQAVSAEELGYQRAIVIPRRGVA
jgi:hypothetical protein